MAVQTVLERPAEAKLIRKIHRVLSPVESFLSAQHLLNLFFSPAVTGRYSIPKSLAGPDRQAALANTVQCAVAATVLEHPLLQSGIVDEDSAQPSWARLDRVDLAALVRWEHVDAYAGYDAALRRAWEREASTRFQRLETQPAFRVTVLRPASRAEGDLIDVVFAYSHTVGDGRSGKIFHEAFLGHLKRLAADPDLAAAAAAPQPALLEIPANLRCTPAPEAMLNLTRSPAFTLAEAWKAFRPKALTPRSPNAASWSPIPVSPPKKRQRRHLRQQQQPQHPQSESEPEAEAEQQQQQQPAAQPPAIPAESPGATNIRLVTIEHGRLQRILETCRGHQTTLTPFLHAMTLASLARRMPERDAPGFISGTPLDLRRHIRPAPGFDPHQTISNLATTISHNFDPALVSDLRAQILRVVVGDDDSSSSSSSSGSSGSDATDSEDGGDADRRRQRQQQIRRAAAEQKLEETVWSVSRTVGAELKTKLDAGTHNDPMCLLKFLNDPRPVVKDRLCKTRERTWQISNLGVMGGGDDNSKPAPAPAAAPADGSGSGSGSGDESSSEDGHVMSSSASSSSSTNADGDGWSFERAVFTRGPWTLDAVLRWSVVAVKGGTLALALTWQDGAVDAAIAEGLLADARACLESLGDTGRFRLAPASAAAAASPSYSSVPGETAASAPPATPPRPGPPQQTASLSPEQGLPPKSRLRGARSQDTLRVPMRVRLRRSLRSLIE